MAKCAHLDSKPGVKMHCLEISVSEVREMRHGALTEHRKCLDPSAWVESLIPLPFFFSPRIEVIHQAFISAKLPQLHPFLFGIFHITL